MPHGYSVVYADGACSGNGQPGASGGIGIYVPGAPSKSVCAPVSGSRQTNNAAGIQAATEAVRIGQSMGKTSLTVKTDSALVKNAHEQYIPKWESNGYMNSRNKPVVNQQEFRELHRTINDSNMKVKFEHVPANSGNRGHDMATNLARGSAGSRNYGGGSGNGGGNGGNKSYGNGGYKSYGGGYY